MKIGVTGSDHICDRIQKTLEKRMPDLEVVYRRSNDYRYGLEAAAQFQKGKVSGIIFTGPTNYHYALKRLEPNVPWTFLPHNQASILKALAESAVRYSCVPDVISIDMYEEQLVQETLEEIGISNGRVLVAHGSSPDQDDFQEIQERGQGESPVEQGVQGQSAHAEKNAHAVDHAGGVKP